MLAMRIATSAMKKAINDVDIYHALGLCTVVGYQDCEQNLCFSSQFETFCQRLR